jgi:hypothetical protein
MLIVDDQYMLFALSTRAPRHAVSNGMDKYINVGVFLIEDRSGKTIQSFISAFDRFFENSFRINSVVDDTEETSGVSVNTAMPSNN